MNSVVCPYSDEFPPALKSYCEQMRAAVAKGTTHHDQRRSLLLNFLREGMGIESTNIELERKIKAAEIRGRIDAFWRHLIIEVKTDLDRERNDAREELKKYFEAQRHPPEYLALVTDGLRFEVYLYESAKAGVRLIGGFELKPDQPLAAFRHLDQVFFTGQRLAPTSGDIVIRLGRDSAAFNASLRRLGDLYDAVASDSTVQTKFREWNTLLAKVYGSALGDRALFLKHTYLVMVSRAVVAAALAPVQLGTVKQFRGLVDGEFFRALGIQNLAEPDFFSWALDTPSEAGFCDFIHQLLGSLSVYDFAKLDEDILKELYQGLVDPESRHDLGEYYTPDWLTELTLEQINYRGGKLLDPSCGSGGFLFAAVQRLRATGLKGSRLVKAVVESVVGVDVHPVAVLMAKANLLLGMAEDRAGYGDFIPLPVYMADTLMTDEDARQGVLRVKVSETETFNVPLGTLTSQKMDQTIDLLCGLAVRSLKSDRLEKAAATGVQRVLAKLPAQERFFWRQNYSLLRKLEQERRNTVWAYILKNAYRPLFLRREKVDYIVGNPPWLSLRYVKDQGYKERIKELTFQHGLLAKTDVKLFTQMDTSTLFFNHCAKEFLKPGGTIAFVLPKTVILPAKQHAKFQEQGFNEVHDFTEVAPLFNVRTCLVIRGPKPLKARIPRTKWAANLPQRNANLTEARRLLSSEQDLFSFLANGVPLSPYFEKFLNGANLYPRCPIFVAPPEDRPLIAEAPFLETSGDALRESKPNWRVKLAGQVEKALLFGTVLAKDLIPFAVRKLSLVVLPVKETSHHDLRMLNSAALLNEGFQHAHDWFQRAERLWEERRKDDAMSLQETLDFNGKLTQQSLRAKFIVLSNKSGTNLSAAMLTPSETKKIGALPIRGFITDNVCYRYYAASEEEAAYLVGILNTTVVNEAIKPYQPEGLLGERDIHRRPFEACAIPLFDAKNKLHQRITEAAHKAREELLPVVPKMQTPVATARADARCLVANQLRKLDGLVAQLLDGQPVKYPAPKSEPMKLLELF
ncbi:MAG: N-6 DNA methylase [Verrucomicrobia bacterium]|nr:N-6 DNA methylase [Verrucomicrobiota bacterium]